MKLLSKPIQATPTISGKYAEKIIKERLRTPSEKAIKRNKEASELLKRLKGY